MDFGYICSLTKGVLAYNLIYHLKECKTEEEISEVVNRTLDSFEIIKSDNPSNC